MQGDEVAVAAGSSGRTSATAVGLAVVWLYFTAVAEVHSGLVDPVGLTAVDGHADVVVDLGVLERVTGVGGDLLRLGEPAPNTVGMSANFSSTMLAVETSPTLQPAFVNGTHGAGAMAS